MLMLRARYCFRLILFYIYAKWKLWIYFFIKNSSQTVPSEKSIYYNQVKSEYMLSVYRYTNLLNLLSNGFSLLLGYVCSARHTGRRRRWSPHLQGVQGDRTRKEAYYRMSRILPQICTASAEVYMEHVIKPM